MIKMILKAIFGAIIITTVVVSSFAALTGAPFILCGIPVLLFFSGLAIWLVWKYGYRPQENHLGVIYRFERFHRFIPPNNWIFLFPFIDSVHHEVSLFMRTTEINLTDVELRDGLIIDVRIKVFFRTDPRLANSENLLQVLKFEGVEWPEMVKTSTEDVVRNQVFLNLNYAEIIDMRKSREIKSIISRALAERMRSFGVVINEGFGVMPVAVQPNQLYRNAIQASKAAAPMGEAALERLRPVLDAMKKLIPENAQAALLLEVASKIVETGQLPEIVLSPSSELPISPSHGNGNGRHPFPERTILKDLPFAK